MVPCLPGISGSYQDMRFPTDPEGPGEVKRWKIGTFCCTTLLNAIFLIIFTIIPAHGKIFTPTKSDYVGSSFAELRFPAAT